MPRRLNILDGTPSPVVIIDHVWFEIPKETTELVKYDEYLLRPAVADYIEKLENEIKKNEETIALLIKQQEK